MVSTPGKGTEGARSRGLKVPLGISRALYPSPREGKEALETSRSRRLRPGEAGVGAVAEEGREGSTTAEDAASASHQKLTYTSRRPSRSPHGSNPIAQTTRLLAKLIDLLGVNRRSISRRPGLLELGRDRETRRQRSAPMQLVEADCRRWCDGR